MSKTKPFIYLPLHQEPERSLLIAAPKFSDQIETIKQIAKNLPKTISIYSDWKNLCKDPGIEAVFFLTSGAHSLMSKYALLNNKHVFAEKDNEFSKAFIFEV